MAFLSVGSEFFINSQELEDKVRNLLPSQGGAGSGFDLSASTQIIPIIDLTESAEGSNVRQDLQTALSFASQTFFTLSNASSDLITNTGYWRLFGTSTINMAGASVREVVIEINDGTSDKTLYRHAIEALSGADSATSLLFDFLVKSTSGDTIKASVSNNCNLCISTRQIADIDGNLVNP